MYKSLQSEQASELFNKALLLWGEPTQALVTVGEMAELTDLLIKKYVQGKPVITSDLLDELADVIIMTAQLSVIYGVDNIEYKLEQKLAKLQKIANSVIREVQNEN